MRNYAPQLVKAYELANSISNPIFDPSILPRILEEEKRLAYSYDNEKSNQAIILYNEETNKILKLPYYMRFKAEYVKAIKHKIWGEIYPQVARYHNFLFASLDGSITRYYSQADAHRQANRRWNSLLTRVRRRFPWVKIIKVVEWQKNGLGYHIHVLFCGVRFIPIEWIRKTWDKLEPNPHSVQLDNKFKTFEDPKRALGYLMKYVTKTLRQGDEIPMSLVINWALGLRTLAFSHLFSRFSSSKTNSNGKSRGVWVFIGIMPWDLAVSSSDVEILAYFGYG